MQLDSITRALCAHILERVESGWHSLLILLILAGLPTFVISCFNTGINEHRCACGVWPCSVFDKERAVSHGIPGCSLSAPCCVHCCSVSLCEALACAVFVCVYMCASMQAGVCVCALR